MTDYATQADLETRFGPEELKQLTDRTNYPGTTIDVTVVAEALTDAQSEIDGYIGTKYDLPLASVPPRLTKVACDIARYYLHGKAADESVRTAYEDAVKWLVNVSKGVVQLEAETGESEPASIGGVQVSQGGGYFDPDLMGDF